MANLLQDRIQARRLACLKLPFARYFRFLSQQRLSVLSKSVKRHPELPPLRHEELPPPLG
jgi:hypothetical protein